MKIEIRGSGAAQRQLRGRHGAADQADAAVGGSHHESVRDRRHARRIAEEINDPCEARFRHAILALTHF